MTTVELTVEECKAVHDTIDGLSGCNPEYVFLYYATGDLDDPDDPTARAFAKIYRAAGRSVPPNLQDV